MGAAVIPARYLCRLQVALLGYFLPFLRASIASSMTYFRVTRFFGFGATFFVFFVNIVIPHFCYGTIGILTAAHLPSCLDGHMNRAAHPVMSTLAAPVVSLEPWRFTVAAPPS